MVGMTQASGLLTRKPAPAPVDGEEMPEGADQQQTASAGDEQGEAPNVSPEEQAQYDQFVEKAFSVIFDKRTMPGITESLKGAGDPVDGLAHTAVSVTLRVNEAAEKAGQKISDDVLLHAGVAILEELATLAEKSKLHDYTDKEIEAATLRAMDLARDTLTKTGRANPDELKQDFTGLVEADKAGKLGEVLPGLGQGAAPADKSEETV